MKNLIIIPTYNEADNISDLIKEIFKLDLGLDILVVDDNSPDGTAHKVKTLQTNYSNLFLLERQKKDGLGQAYLAGFAWAYDHNYEIVIQMDADFSHSPKHLPTMLQALATNDFVIGSRYVKGGGVVNWPIIRQLISRGGSLYARLILGLNIKDLTGGFNGWHQNIFKKFTPETIKSNGYCFQIELKNTAARAGHTYQEIPITFEERRNGQSKLKGKIVWEAIWRVWQIRAKSINWKIAGILTAVLLTTIITYWPALHGQFLNWDDAMQVTANNDIKNLSIHNLDDIFSNFYVGMYQPLTSLTYAIEYHWFGLNNFTFHLFSLIIHLINILLVFCLFKTLKTKNWLALTASALFALQPMNVEAVAWVSATSTLLYSAWLLLATIFYLKYLQQNKRPYLWLSLIAFIFSVLSKSAGVIFPLIMLMALWLEKKSIKKTWPELSLSFIISGLFGYLTLFGRQTADHLVDFGHLYNFLERTLFVGYSMIFYIIKFFIPTNLSAYYIYPQKNPSLPWIVYVATPAIITIISLIIYFYKKQKLSRLMIFACLWWLANLILVLKIIPLGTQITADRYNYLPMLGLILFIGLLFQTTKSNKILKTTGLIVLLFTLAFWSYLSRQQTKLWHDNLTFFNTTIPQAPREAGLYDLRSLSKREVGDFNGALEDATRATQLEPENDMMHNDRSIILAENFQRYDEAIKEITLAITLRPRFALYYYNRATFKAFNHDCANALTDFNTALDLAPRTQYYFNRGNCHFELKQYQNALNDYQQAIKLSPNFNLAYFNQGQAFMASNQKDQACVSFQQASALGNQNAVNFIKTNCQK